MRMTLHRRPATTSKRSPFEHARLGPARGPADNNRPARRGTVAGSAGRTDHHRACLVGIVLAGGNRAAAALRDLPWAVRGGVARVTWSAFGIQATRRTRLMVSSVPRDCAHRLGRQL